MEIRFSVTPSQYQEYLKYASARIVKLSKSAWLVPTLNFTMWFIIMFLFMGVFRFLSTQTNIDPNIVLYSALLFIALVLIYLMGIHLKYRALLNNYCNENGLLTGEITIVLSDEHLGVHSSHFRAQYYWPTIQDVTQSKNLIYVFYDNSLAQIIPKRVFADPAHMQEFLSFIEEKRTARAKNNYLALSPSLSSLPDLFG